MLSVVPFADAINVHYTLLFGFVQNSLYILRRVWDFLSSYYTFEDLLCVGLVLVMHNSRAIDQVNSLGQSNILPHFGLSRDWGNSAAVLFHQGVDHRRFSDVGVADQTNGNVFLIFMEDIELFEQLDQRSLSKGIRNGSLESESWGCLGQIFDPFLCD